MKHSIDVIAEHYRGAVRLVTFELVGFAGRLREITGLPIRIVISGADVSETADMLAERTGAEVIALENLIFEHYLGESYRRALCDLYENRKPAYICAGHTSQGMDFAPGLAIRLAAAHISGVREILPDETAGVCFIRSIQGGQKTASVRPLTETVVLTVQPGCFGPAVPPSHTIRKVRREKVPCTADQSRFVTHKPAMPREAALNEADVIVSAGNGVGDALQIDLIRRLAEKIPKSSVAGSRIVCDKGWLPRNLQVGATGATVSPKLYIACGISGAPQHLTGMSGSEMIVAVNTDARATLMNHADICIIEDLETFIPLRIDRLSRPPDEGKG